jgi:hypothetical protein
MVVETAAPLTVIEAPVVVHDGMRTFNDQVFVLVPEMVRVEVVEYGKLVAWVIVMPCWVHLRTEGVKRLT